MGFGLCILIPFQYANAQTLSKFIEQYEQLDEIKKKEVNEIIENLNTELEKLGIHPPDIQVHKAFSNLDEETKEKVKKVMKDFENGKITVEQADKKLIELGIPLKKKDCKVFEGLDEETKEKAKKIMRDKKKGIITSEEAQEKLKALGVELPKEKQLNEETKKQVKQLVEQAAEEFKQIGIEFPISKYEHLTK